MGALSLCSSDFFSLKMSQTDGLVWRGRVNRPFYCMPIFQIFSGDPITDRKSTFQAFLANAVHPKQAMCVLAKLKENKKIQNAAHNMWAFRIGGMAIRSVVIDRVILMFAIYCIIK